MNQLTETPASKWATALQVPIMAALQSKGVKAIDFGEDFIDFKAPIGTTFRLKITERRPLTQEEKDVKKLVDEIMEITKL